MKSSVFISISLLVVSLAQASRLPARYVQKSPRIFGGDVAEPHSMPYLALLEFYSDYYATYCTGALISQNYVLTSGTCAAGSIEVLVTLGAHNVFITEETQINVYSKDIKFHDGYKESDYMNDLVLIKLPYPVVFTRAIQPVALPRKKDVDQVYLGFVGKIGGWGTEKENNQQLFEVLRVIDMEIVSNLDPLCRLDQLPSTMFCASGEYQGNFVGPCNFDYGTSFVVGNVLLGIMSFGEGYCLHGYPAAFTRVVNFLDWIEANSDIIVN